MKFQFAFILLLYILPFHAQKTYKKEIRQYRKAYKQAFLKAGKSPLDEKGVKKICFFPIRTSYKSIGQFVRTPDAEPFQMATYDGQTQAYVQYGTVTFTLQGQAFQLAIYRNLQNLRMPQGRNKLFVPFTDLSNGESTYEGGRYLDLNISEIQDNQLILDFNKAYNPYCAYSDGWTCPIPPSENHLDIAVKAGEKEYKR